MYLFHNDYNQTAHPTVLKKMAQNPELQYPGYGLDDSCKRAAGYIRELCKDDKMYVHFLVGGTQTNLSVIASALRPHQGVLGAEPAHINVHETGAIEATGHKVVTLSSDDGKLTAQQVAAYAEMQASDENAEHTVQVKMVYISHPTELGTTYKLKELEDLSAVCRKNGLYLYLDGARLGYALAAGDNDISLSDLARLCDVFYIGGTKVGAMFGEAVVFSNADLGRDFRYTMKQRGGMLAKGWLLGLQFEALLEDGLYFRISEYADSLADRLRDTLNQCGYPLLVPGTTNQVFAILPNQLLEEMSAEFTFMIQEKTDENNSAVRFCTSWATKADAVDRLCKLIYNYKIKEGSAGAH